MVTPFDAHSRIDHGGARQLVDFFLAHGVHGLMAGGTTGEGMLLSLEERKALCETVVERVAGRAPVIAHTGCIGTADTVDLTCHAASVGATAAAMIVPYFFTFDDESLFAHYVTIAHAVPDFPLFIYAFPGNARNDVSPGLLRRLRDAAPNIAGIKSTNPDLMRFQEYVAAGGEGFVPINGVDGLTLPALALGAVGQISGNVNAFPEVFRGLYDAFMAGDVERARSHQCTINRIRRMLKDGLHPAYFKAALALNGVPAGRVRPPMRELAEREMVELERAINGLGKVLVSAGK
jgi:dihydrodipicolinate synthase/N-acetylneuraminate lyase